MSPREEQMLAMRTIKWEKLDEILKKLDKEEQKGCIPREVLEAK